MLTLEHQQVVMTSFLQFITTATIFFAAVVDADVQLDPVNFYRSECPSARGIVGRKVLNAIWKQKGLPSALLRLQFHDCFVRGCDASILLDSQFSNVAEKDGTGNAFSLRGFEIFDDIKEELEAVCPLTVSCADIIALASRDAVTAIGGPSWSVQSGRFDGLVSYASDTAEFLPPPGANYAQLSQLFASKGFSEWEMVVLSGAHTIGVTHCGQISYRLYNGTGADNVDPTLDLPYAVELKKHCSCGNVSTPVLLDPTRGGYAFDNNYFVNLLQNRGIFQSDAALVSTESGRRFVLEAALSQKSFLIAFVAAMEKLSIVEVKNGTEGEIRRHCRYTNQM